MATWVPFVMLVLAGFLLGGVISFAKTKKWAGVVILGFAAVLALVAAAAWWRPE